MTLCHIEDIRRAVRPRCPERTSPNWRSRLAKALSADCEKHELKRMEEEPQRLKETERENDSSGREVKSH